LSNKVANALPRKFSDEKSLWLAISSLIPALVSQLQQYYNTDPIGRETIKTGQIPRVASKLSTANGILYYQDKIFIPDHREMRQALLKEFYATPVAGHLGVKPAVARLSSSFFWPGLYTDVKEMVKRCSICQTSKYQLMKKKGLLQPLPVPERVWEELSIYFIMHLPSSFDHTTIWVICDRFTKYSHFIALSSH
jgi:hypothetical protein